jgi:hypothetical protein
MRDAVPPEEMRELRIAAASLANESLAITGGLLPTMANAAAWQDFWLARILAPQATSITATVTVTDQHGHVTTQFTSQGGTMADVAMTMDDTATLTAEPEDDHGDPTSDTLTFTGSDGGTVLTLLAAGDVCTATPVAEGTATVTVADPSAPNAAPWVVNFTVGPGATASVQGTVTVNTGANAVPPAV